MTATANDSRTGAPELSIVIVSWNSSPDLAQCIQSLFEFTVSVSFEVVVIDNASSDGSASMLRERFPQVQVIENAENVGFARACNDGVARSRGQHILLINSDTYVVDDVIGRCAQELASRPDIGMIGCELRWPDGRRQHTANRALGIRRSLVERLWLYKLLPRRRRAETLLGGYWEGDREIEVDWLAGAFMLFRRELFERSGGFDPRFFMYGEDSEWCMRLGRLGYRIIYAPRLGTVYHRGAASSDVAWSERERLRRCYEGGIGAYAALHGARRTLLYRLAELIGVAVRWSVHRGASVLRGSTYHREQARFYGWLVSFYIKGDRSGAQRHQTEP
jgi:GT2 family glycosyltransferase